MKNYIDTAESMLLHTYNRYQVVLDRGEGVYVYDLNGKRYLDFFAGIGVYALGYHYPGYDQALKDQIDKLLHTSNYYYNVPSIKAAEAILKISGMDRVFFTNSGAEAVEGALKAAKKYYYKKTGKNDGEFIALNGSFHGRTMGALSVTGTSKYREPFEPLGGRVNFVDINDIEGLKAVVKDNTCGIIMETIQGEGGIRPADGSYLKEVRQICDERDIVLILDEIQCGMGRTGSYFAWQALGVKPDIMTTAKAVGGGVPVGAFLMTERMGQSTLEAGDHGTTYGGNPLATAAIVKTLEIFEQDKILDHVNKVSKYLEKRLNELKSNHDYIIDHRGRGLIRGLECSGPVADIISMALEKGLILINAGSNVIRILPPLIIEEKHVDEMMDIMEECFKCLD